MTRRVLVKFGGATLADPRLRAALAADLASIPSDVQLIIVHGGGPQTSALAQRLGLQP